MRKIAVSVVGNWMRNRTGVNPLKDFVTAARRDPGRSSMIARTLFHWCTARWVHEDRLRATLPGR